MRRCQTACLMVTDNSVCDNETVSKTFTDVWLTVSFVMSHGVASSSLYDLPSAWRY